MHTVASAQRALGHRVHVAAVARALQSMNKHEVAHCRPLGLLHVYENLDVGFGWKVNGVDGEPPFVQLPRP